MKATMCVCVFSMLAVTACAGSKPEAKTAADTPPPPTAPTASASAVPAATASAAPTADAGAPDAPPPPSATPPSQKPPVIQVVWDGLTREVSEGETFNVDGDLRRQLLFYSTAAAADCSNVSVTGLVARTMAGLCQVAFLPLDQKFSEGEEQPASITVDQGGQSVTRSFRVARR